MPEEKQKRSRRWLWLLPVPLLAAVGVLAALLVSGGLSARYDDPAALAESPLAVGFDAVEVHPDGTVTARLGKEALYRFAREYGVGGEAAERLGEGAAIARQGFRISDGALSVYAERRLLGLLPVAYRADMSLERQGELLVLRTESVTLGSRLPLPPRRWPGIFREELSIDLSPSGIAESLEDAYLQGSQLVLELRGLREASLYGLTVDWELLRALDVFRGPEAEGELLARLRRAYAMENHAEALREEILASEDVEAALTELMSCCRPGSLQTLWEGESPFLRRYLWGPLEQAAALRRQKLEDGLSEEQSKYEKLLFALREMYRSYALKIDVSGFVAAAGGETVDPSTLSRLPVTDADSRIVFLTSASGEDVSLSLEDMPPLHTMKWVNWQSAPLVDPELVLDVGVALPTAGDVPLLLSRGRDGAFLLRELSQETFVEILVDPGIYTLDVDALPPPAEVIRRPSGEGWSGAEIWTLPGN